MTKKSRKILSIVLALVLVIGYIPARALAVGQNTTALSLGQEQNFTIAQQGDQERFTFTAPQAGDYILYSRDVHKGQPISNSFDPGCTMYTGSSEEGRYELYEKTLAVGEEIFLGFGMPNVPEAAPYTGIVGVVAKPDDTAYDGLHTHWTQLNANGEVCFNMSMGSQGHILVCPDNQLISDIAWTVTSSDPSVVAVTTDNVLQHSKKIYCEVVLDPVSTGTATITVEGTYGNVKRAQTIQVTVDQGGPGGPGMGPVAFNTLAELETMLSSGTRGDFQYTGNGTLVIDHDLTIPDGCFLHVDHLQVNTDVKLTLEREAFLDVPGTLLVDGSIVSKGWTQINCQVDTKIFGINNIVCVNPDAPAITTGAEAADETELRQLVDIASNYGGFENRVYNFNVVGTIALNSDFTQPEGVNLHIMQPFTVSPGVTLEVNAAFNVNNTFVVQGNLTNNRDIFVYSRSSDDPQGTILLDSGAKYQGNGAIQVYADDLSTRPASILFDPADFGLHEFQPQWEKVWVLTTDPNFGGGPGGPGMGSVAFNTLAELETMLNSGTRGDFQYTGNGTLVIDHDLTIPNGCFLHTDHLQVATGVTLMLKPEAHLSVPGTLLVDGSIVSQGWTQISCLINTTISGANRIVCTNSDMPAITMGGAANDETELRALVQKAESNGTQNRVYNFDVHCAITLNSDFTQPDGVNLQIMQPFTVPSGVTLEVNAAFNVNNAFVVQGNLTNNGDIFVYSRSSDDPKGTILLDSGAKYQGDGAIQVYADDLSARPASILFDPADFGLHEFQFADGDEKEWVLTTQDDFGSGGFGGPEFANLAELKQLIADGFGGQVLYNGAGTLVINENLTIPDGMEVIADDVQIASGFKLTVPEQAGMFVNQSLQVDGALDTQSRSFSVGLGATVSGFANITFGEDNHMNVVADVETLDEIKAVMAAIPSHTLYENTHVEYGVNLGERSVTLTDSLTIPKKVTLMMSPGAFFTVNSGATLSVNGTLFITRSSTINGNLVNNGSVLVFSDDENGADLTFNAGSTYSGTGDLIVDCSGGRTFDDAVRNLPENLYCWTADRMEGHWEYSAVKPTADDVNSMLAEVVAEVEGSGDPIPAADIRNAVQSLNRDAMVEALLEDTSRTGTTSDLKKLEAAVGGAAQVTVEQASGVRSGVSIVGANLNSKVSDASPIRLVVDAPAQTHTLDSAFRADNAVVFSMTLENAQSAADLFVPVKVTLPIPASINKALLQVLHFSADGSFESITPYVYEQDGQWFADIVLTGFSDFAMVERVCSHAFGEGHTCGICGETVSACADTNKDHKCDICGKVLTECADANKDHKCDLCGKVLTECADANKDHKCDICGKELTQCADANKDHKCDTCGKVLTECSDANKDGKCDLCGKNVGKYEDVKPATGEIKDITGTQEAAAEENPLDAVIENTTSLESAIGVTAEQKAQGVNVWLDVSDASAAVSAADKALIEEAADGMQVGMYLDISLSMKVGDNAAEAVHELNSKLKISITVPEDLRKADREFCIVRVHEGVPTVIEGVYDEATHTFTFETDRFSSYTLIYSDPMPLPSNPATGDSSPILLWTVLFLVSAMGLGAIALIRKKEIFQ